LFLHTETKIVLPCMRSVSLCYQLWTVLQRQSEGASDNLAAASGWQLLSYRTLGYATLQFRPTSGLLNVWSVFRLKLKKSL